jgi:hypothetical protein
VRALPGNTAPVIVYESIGNGQFEVVPTEKMVFHGGKLNTADTAFHGGQLSQVETIVPDDCGCPAPPPVLLAGVPGEPKQVENEVSSTTPPPQLEDDTRLQRMAAMQIPLNGPQIAPVPQLASDETAVKLSASLVFSAKDRLPRPVDLPLSQRPIPSLPEMVQPPAQAPITDKKSQKGVLRKLTRFISRIFS